VDAILRELGGFFSWYLIATIAGLIAFPLVFKFLPALRDRGYTFSRAVGLITWGFLYWLLSSFGILKNNIQSLLIAMGLLVLLDGIIIGKRGIGRVIAWSNNNRGLIITTEVLFLGAFALWAFIRSANPEIAGTEKPMELAFINSILRSPGMPPLDPWLSGYAISYYYFGYVLVAMLIRLSGVISGVGFNLAIALWFALSAVGAYGLVFNLLPAGRRNKDRSARAGLYTLPLFGPLFLLIVANLEGFLEILHARGLFWKHLTEDTWISFFWKWLDILDLTIQPSQPFSWLPTRYLPWWRASRVLQDYDLLGAPREIIDEFPQFSYLLADLHPHLLAMPFVLLGIAISLNLYRSRRLKTASLAGIQLPIRWSDLLFTGVCLGGLGFLNIWDFPFAVLLFTGAYLIKRSASERINIRLIADCIWLFFLVILVGVALYLPFYLSFSSQAGGIVPSLIYVTRGAHFWVMFAPLLLPMGAYLVWSIRREKAEQRFIRALLISTAIMIILFVTMLLAGWIAWSIPALRMVLESIFNAQGQSYITVVVESIQRRIVAPGTWLTLLGLLAGLIALIFRKVRNTSNEISLRNMPDRPIGRKVDFSFIVMSVGILLLILPEFFYLHDQFGWRMNTIFKFYFHAWLLLSICAAVAFVRVFSKTRGVGWSIVRWGLLVVLIASLVYTPVMLDIKTNHFGFGNFRTLNGNQYFINLYPEEAQAIDWLSLQEPGIIAEAIGGSYSGFARVSTLSGFPTILGWPGHESQWRGGGEEMGSRFSDIETLYATTEWSLAVSIIQQYEIRYIYIGNLERSTYRVSDYKFRQNLSVVYEQGSVIIFEMVLNDNSVDRITGNE
jgi:YYY domain-containing protein